MTKTEIRFDDAIPSDKAVRLSTALQVIDQNAPSMTRSGTGDVDWEVSPKDFQEILNFIHHYGGVPCTGSQHAACPAGFNATYAFFHSEDKYPFLPIGEDKEVFSTIYEMVKD